MSTLLSGANDPQALPAPTDTVQCVKFSPNSTLLAASAWDGTVSVWQVHEGLRAEARLQIREDCAVLGVAWNTEGTTLCLGGTEGKLKVWDLQRNALVEIGSHHSGVRAVAWADDSRYIISGSWDRSVGFWDPRSSSLALEISTRGRVFGLALSRSLLATIQSDHQIAVWDLRHLQQRKEPEYVNDMTGKYQLRAVGVTNSGKALAVGTVDGRVILKKVPTSTVLHVETDFSFRSSHNSHSINSLCYHPFSDLLYTAGSEGVISGWNCGTRQKESTYGELGGPVTAMDVAGDAGTMAYAVGYDWGTGVEGQGSVGVKIGLRNLQASVRPTKI